MRPHLRLRLALADALDAVADLRTALDRIHDAADAVADEHEQLPSVDGEADDDADPTD